MKSKNTLSILPFVFHTKYSNVISLNKIFRKGTFHVFHLLLQRIYKINCLQFTK